MMPKHSIKPEQLLSDAVAGVVKLEEVLSGVTLHRLLFAPALKGIVKALTLNDWYSLVWQSMMAHFVLQVNAGVLHRDAHSSNIMVSIMHSPTSLGYEWDDSLLVAPESRLLVQRMDWSDAIPYKSLDEFDRSACFATY
jgi:hypothetical protein